MHTEAVVLTELFIKLSLLLQKFIIIKMFCYERLPVNIKMSLIVQTFNYGSELFCHVNYHLGNKL